MAGADLLWENNIVDWLVAGADLVWENSTASWLADKPSDAESQSGAPSFLYVASDLQSKSWSAISAKKKSCGVPVQQVMVSYGCYS